MSFIVTADGHELSLLWPGLQQLTPTSIAWSLAQINRFNGHALRPYSVAEHSLLVCDIVERELGLDVHGQLLALMHDAHEAFCGDMHTPGKAQIPGWRGWEQRWEHLVRNAFGLKVTHAVHRADVKRADLIALATERAQLLNPAAQTPWQALAGVEPVTWARLRTPERADQPWHFWRDRWLDRFQELQFARAELAATPEAS